MKACSPKDVVERMTKDGFKLVVAESCTGGLVASRITDIPGASKMFVGGVIAYENRIKVSHLGVPADLFTDGHGSVSASVAEAMADGVRGHLGGDVALAVTGIAGPTGGTDKKPVGTVWLACHGPGDLVNVHRLQAEGDRKQIRAAAADAALALLCRNLDEAEAVA